MAENFIGHAGCNRLTNIYEALFFAGTARPLALQIWLPGFHLAAAAALLQ